MKTKHSAVSTPASHPSNAGTNAVNTAVNEAVNATHYSASAIVLPVPEPLAPGLPLPHRKVIRSWLAPLSRGTVAHSIILLSVDWLVFASLIVGVVLISALWLKLLLGAAAGFMIGRLFILGHDACHMSFTPNRKLNQWLGRIAFLPSLTPYSLWDVGHNVVHHGYTNLKGVDFVWEPRSVEEFAALPAWRRTLERIYRSGWAPWLYYLVEIWWLKMYFPSKERMPTRRSAFMWDGLLVTAVAAMWSAALLWAAQLTHQSAWLLWSTGFLLPFIFWNGMIGFVVYVHHTHTSVAWYDDKNIWAKAQPFVSTTVHLTFSKGVGALLHHIMEHTAHHVDMSIPLYHLKQAQQLLEHALPDRIVIQRFSWKWYFETAQRCKLYDFKARCWLDFAGKQTAAPVVLV